MTTRDERKADVQAFIDTLSIVERHRVCRALNVFENGPYDEMTAMYAAYQRNWTMRLYVSPELNLCMFLVEYTKTATGGRKDLQ